VLFRSYEIFVILLNCLAEGMEIKAAKKMLAEKFDVEPKSIDRDISAIREFLQEKMSEND
jgi:hypothetical protein